MQNYAEYDNSDRKHRKETITHGEIFRRNFDDEVEEDEIYDSDYDDEEEDDYDEDYDDEDYDDDEDEEDTDVPI